MLKSSTDFMPEAIRNQYRELVRKFIDGTISAEEMQVLERYYSLFRDEPEATSNMDDQQLAALEGRLQKGIEARISQSEEDANTIVPIYKRTWFRVAAVLAIGLTATLMLVNKPASKQVVFVTPTSPSVITAVANHFVTLPDSSRIVLHAGSKLVVANDFKTGGNREVTLVGEAYFDIKHNEKRPFIIHTGAINTTVLGTAFNIKAYAGDKTITVTVTRGRVKVERGQDLLAVLTPNKQIIANLDNKQVVESPQEVVAVKALSWARSDMRFDAMPFGKLAEHLDSRYDVHITFKNQALAGCPITGSFTGTESLKEVLDDLSQTRGTTYVINGQNVVIDGNGCN